MLEFQFDKCDGFVTQKSHYSFIRGVENDTKGWESCVKNSGREKAINDCYNGDLYRKVPIYELKKTLIITLHVTILLCVICN